MGAKNQLKMEHRFSRFQEREYPINQLVDEYFQVVHPSNIDIVLRFQEIHAACRPCVLHLPKQFGILPGHPA